MSEWVVPPVGGDDPFGNEEESQMLSPQDVLVYDPVTTFFNNLALAFGSTDAIIMT
ncbi:hypothetical protein [Rhodococcus sp. NPDC058514]|uniref:hypothetical protein n=1 Tax=Rhodococcus sp. NPDC058514 TaxID=3346532 RepID=UPI003664DBC1